MSIILFLKIFYKSRREIYSTINMSVKALRPLSVSIPPELSGLTAGFLGG